MNKRLEKVANTLVTVQTAISKLQFGDCNTVDDFAVIKELKAKVDAVHEYLMNKAMQGIKETELEGGDENIRAKNSLNQPLYLDKNHQLTTARKG